MALSSPRTIRRPHRAQYGAAQNPFHPENASATRTLVAAASGALVPGFVGWALGLVAPGISGVQLGTIGALAGASLSAYKSLRNQGAITSDGT